MEEGLVGELGAVEIADGEGARAEPAGGIRE
jgi:hypothetical protein